MKPLKDSAVITGILYQQKGSTDVQLLSGLKFGVKLLEAAPITGFTYTEKESSEQKLLSGLRISGMVHKQENTPDQGILRSAQICGVIFRNRGVVQDSATRGATDDSSEAEMASSFEAALFKDAKIAGIIYRENGAGDEQIASKSTVEMKILNASSVVGIVYEGPHGENIKHLSGSEITGLLFQQENAKTETILGDKAILGIIYQEKYAGLENLANGSRRWTTAAKRAVPYLLSIIGAAGLLILFLSQETGALSSNFLAFPSAIITLLLIVLVIVPVIALIYQRHRKNRSTVLSS